MLLCVLRGEQKSLVKPFRRKKFPNTVQVRKAARTRSRLCLEAMSAGGEGVSPAPVMENAKGFLKNALMCWGIGEEGKL